MIVCSEQKIEVLGASDFFPSRSAKFDVYSIYSADLLIKNCRNKKIRWSSVIWTGEGDMDRRVNITLSPVSGEIEPLVIFTYKHKLIDYLQSVN